MTDHDAYLLPPPDISESASAAPHFGRLVLGADPERRVDDVEPFELDRIEPHRLDQELLKKLSSNKRITDHLDAAAAAGAWGENRPDWSILGIRHGAEPKGEDEAITPIVAHGYDYRNAQGFVVTGDPGLGELTIENVEYELPPSDEELGHATRLALSHPRIADTDRERDGLQIRTIPVGRGSRGDTRLRRAIEVVMVHPAERLPRCRIIVDLVADRCFEVLESPCGCLDQEGGEA